MAELVLAAATPHNPLLWRTMVEPIPEDLLGVAGNFRAIADLIRELEVDLIVLVGSDHVRQFHSELSPAFVVGKAESYHGTWQNEARAFGMPYVEVTGHRELADAITGREMLTEAIDFAVSSEWRLDHGFILPMLYLTPDLDIPIVPIQVNSTLQPFPTPRRFAALGRHIADSIAAWDSPARVAVITSGHMSTEIGGPRQFLGGGSSDPDFDVEAVGWLADGDLDAAIAGCSYERVLASGNLSYQYVNVLTAFAAMGGAPADFAEATPSRYAPSPFFWWRKP
ncbi:MAG: hypothetical protein ABWY30_02405 [Microterricola sp.]